MALLEAAVIVVAGEMPPQSKSGAGTAPSLSATVPTPASPSSGGASPVQAGDSKGRKWSIDEAHASRLYSPDAISFNADWSPLSASSPFSSPTNPLSAGTSGSSQWSRVNAPGSSASSSDSDGECEGADADDEDECVSHLDFSLEEDDGYGHVVEGQQARYRQRERERAQERREEKIDPFVPVHEIDVNGPGAYTYPYGYTPTSRQQGYAHNTHIAYAEPEYDHQYDDREDQDRTITRSLRAALLRSLPPQSLSPTPEQYFVEQVVDWAALLGPLDELLREDPRASWVEVCYCEAAGERVAAVTSVQPGVEERAERFERVRSPYADLEESSEDDERESSATESGTGTGTEGGVREESISTTHNESDNRAEFDTQRRQESELEEEHYAFADNADAVSFLSDADWVRTAMGLADRPLSVASFSPPAVAHRQSPSQIQHQQRATRPPRPTIQFPLLPSSSSTSQGPGFADPFNAGGRSLSRGRTPVDPVMSATPYPPASPMRLTPLSGRGLPPVPPLFQGRGSPHAQRSPQTQLAPHTQQSPPSQQTQQRASPVSPRALGSMPILQTHRNNMDADVDRYAEPDGSEGPGPVPRYRDRPLSDPPPYTASVSHSQVIPPPVPPLPSSSYASDSKASRAPVFTAPPAPSTAPAHPPPERRELSRPSRAADHHHQDETDSFEHLQAPVLPFASSSPSRSSPDLLARPLRPSRGFSQAQNQRRPPRPFSPFSIASGYSSSSAYSQNTSAYAQSASQSASAYCTTFAQAQQMSMSTSEFGELGSLPRSIALPPLSGARPSSPAPSSLRRAHAYAYTQPQSGARPQAHSHVRAATAPAASRSTSALDTRSVGILDVLTDAVSVVVPVEDEDEDEDEDLDTFDTPLTPTGPSHSVSRLGGASTSTKALSTLGVDSLPPRPFSPPGTSASKALSMLGLSTDHLPSSSQHPSTSFASSSSSSHTQLPASPTSTNSLLPFFSTPKPHESVGYSPDPDLRSRGRSREWGRGSRSKKEREKEKEALFRGTSVGAVTGTWDSPDESVMPSTSPTDRVSTLQRFANKFSRRALGSVPSVSVGGR